jgi:hypothetical protein
MSERFYILKGKEVVPVEDVLEWGRFFGDGDKRRVAWTDFGENNYVSTVFLGLDHSFGEGPPLIFETMVFGGELDQEQDRYSTWDEAVEGHNRMVERVKKLEGEE